MTQGEIMKLLISVLMTLTFTAKASCLFGDDTWKLVNENKSFKVLATKSIDKDLLNNQEKYWAIAHITNEYEKGMTLNKFLSEEINSYGNELNIKYLYSYKTKRYYALVSSYPGDNEAGYIFDTKTNKVVAWVSDSWISCF
jgi:hypothetical protein